MSDFLILSEKVEQWLQTGNYLTGYELAKSIAEFMETNNLGMQESYKRFTQDKVTIDSKISLKNKIINNKIKNDFRGLIVNQITSYLLGNAVLYDVNEENYSELEKARIKKALNRFCKLNSIDDQNTNLSNYMGACGVGYRLLFNLNNQDKTLLLDPWNTVIFKDNVNEDIILGAYKYNVSVGGKVVTKVEIYTKKLVYVYYLDAVKKMEEPVLHTYDYVPIIAYYNNDLLKSDFYMVESLIDAIDKDLSYFQDEIEYFANAYLVMTGCEISDEALNKARETGVFQIPTPEGKMEFIVKDLNINVLKELIEIYSKNIFNFASVVDFSDDSFSGSSGSGEARRWRLMNLENKTKNKERKMYAGLLQEFKVLTSRWNLIGINLDYLDMNFVFSRNIPVDLLYYADFLDKTGAKISNSTALAQVPFVENPATEIENIESENKEKTAIIENIEV